LLGQEKDEDKGLTPDEADLLLEEAMTVSPLPALKREVKAAMGSKSSRGAMVAKKPAMAPYNSPSFGKLRVTKAKKQSYIQISDQAAKKLVLLANIPGTRPGHAAMIEKVAAFACQPGLTKEKVIEYRNSLYTVS